MIEIQVFVFLKSVGTWQATSLALPLAQHIRSFSLSHRHAQARARAQSVGTK